MIKRKLFLGCKGIDDMSKAIYFMGSKILIRKNTHEFLLPYDDVKSTFSFVTCTEHREKDIYVARSKQPISDEVLIEAGFQAKELKSILSCLNENIQAFLLRHFHRLNWDEQSRFCGTCGNSLLLKEGKIEKRCDTCNIDIFPRFSPAVMVLVYKDDMVLLARSPHFLPGIYGAIAGFVEVGETAEEAAHREVREELGIEITDLQYFGTQTWPFPDSFMVAFSAKYLSGKLSIDLDELEDAQWFHRDKLPDLPSSASISKRLIENFKNKV